MTENTCPELTASKLSRFFFLWTDRLVDKANEPNFSGESLWDINPREKCENVCPKFDRHVHDDICSNVAYSTKENVQLTTPSKDGPRNSNIRHRKEKRYFKSNNEIRNAHGTNHTHSDKEQVFISKAIKKKRNQVSLWFVLLKAFWREFLEGQIYRISEYATVWVTNPLFISFLMDHGDDSNSSIWTGVLLSGALLLLLMMEGLMVEHTFYNKRIIQMHIRSSLMACVYKKAMSLQSKARKKYSLGEMTNYMSSDCDTITYHLSHLAYVVLNPLHFIVVFYQLFSIIGPSAGIGLLAIAFLMPINVYIATKMRSVYDENARVKDQKMKLLNEVLTGIKVLKLNAWEKCFGEKIDAARDNELAVLRRYFNIRAFSTFSWSASPYLMSVVIFSGYIFLNDDIILTAKAAFTVVSLLNLLRYAINQTPEIIFDFIKVNISIKRLQQFLDEDDFEPPNGNNSQSGTSIEITDAAFTWDESSEPTLSNINLIVPVDGLVAVVGQVGAGKSTLISAILGETETIHGQLNVQGNTAYVSQQAWIQNDTLQNNILFGKKMNRKLYDKVIQACALQPDIDVLVAGDKTEIGERGINLSGGQKQRVSLARAVYNDADIYLLDDPLSAVDSRVGKHIFDNVIGGNGLVKDKTRVLVTHNIRYLPDVDDIVVLDNGRVVETGSFHDLLNSDGVFTKVLKSYLAEYEENRDFIEDSEKEEEMDEVMKFKLRRLDSKDKTEYIQYEKHISRESSVSISRQSSSNTCMSVSETNLTSEGKCIEEENVTPVCGMALWDLFIQYVKVFGPWQMLTVCVVYGLYHCLLMGANIWLVGWTEDPLLKNASQHNMTLTKETVWRINMTYLSVYSGLGLLMSLCILLFAFSMTEGVIRACRELHHGMLMSILKSPMRFFDTTPIGRITNRFSRDINMIDDDLPHGIENYLDCGFFITMSLCAVVYSTPTCLAIFIPLTFHYYSVQKRYRNSCGLIRNLETKARSPIESHFTESLMGVETVRAYREQDRFLVTLQKYIDNYHRMSFYHLMYFRWLGMQVLRVGNVVCASVSLLRSVMKGPQSSALLGLGTTFSLEMKSYLGWFVSVQTQMETNITPIDRITQYINSPNEAEWRKSPSLLPYNWPDKGKVEFRNYSLRYRQGMDLVLRNISFTVKEAEKIGIVGRTGAGKSSLMLSLFRLVEPAEGAILIDGVDIGTIGLHDLREKLAIIPQDPVLFSGSLRMNLDPQDLYTDKDIWTALDHTHLRQFVDSLPDRLQSDCGEGGTNFSVGQRQLFCLARTLLRKAKVLVLDEATAAVDMETDDLIQQTIRSEFKDCTVMTIAHRLNTVMDYDRILVLDRGEVTEFDSPDVLLQGKGPFYQMAVDAGLTAAKL